MFLLTYLSTVRLAMSSNVYSSLQETVTIITPCSDQIDSIYRFESILACFICHVIILNYIAIGVIITLHK